MGDVKTNDIKKGWRVRLANGWYGTMADNARGTTRMVRVEGYETETGSVYAHDIVAARNPDGEWFTISHTPAQVKLKKQVETFF